MGENLAFDFSRTLVEPAAEVKPSIHLSVVSDDVPQRKAEEKNCGGFTNWATYGACLYLENDKAANDALFKAFVSKTLDESKIKSQFRIAGIQLDEWMTGEINWQEILTVYFESFGEAAHVTTVAIPENPKVSRDALVILSQVNIEGNLLKLTCGKLEDKKLYKQVDDILQKLGGKWNRSKGGHVFKEDPTEALETVLLTGVVKKPERFGYFPTPRPLAQHVVSLADIQPGMTVLEPSAGQGGLADVITSIEREAIHCLELQAENAAVLQSKGYRVDTVDFMTVNPKPCFDRVVMNPPFERQQDIHHVLHALKFLKPGGKLVSIMSAGFTFRDDRRSCQFRQLVEECGYWEDNPDGSFKPSGTNVNTVTVVIEYDRLAPERSVL